MVRISVRGGLRPPTTELASVEECSQPERGISLRIATTRLARVERCFVTTVWETSPHGDELRGGVGPTVTLLW